MFNFNISPESGEKYSLKADSRDIYQWEKQFKGRSIGMMMDKGSMSMRSLYEIAYVSAKRQGKYSGDIDGFVENNALDFTVEEDEADPTK